MIRIETERISTNDEWSQLRSCLTVDLAVLRQLVTEIGVQRMTNGSISHAVATGLSCLVVFMRAY